MWISKGIDDESFYYLFDGNGNEVQFQIIGDKIAYGKGMNNERRTFITKMTGINQFIPYSVVFDLN